MRGYFYFHYPGAMIANSKYLIDKLSQTAISLIHSLKPHIHIVENALYPL